jgi:hypothetical protein
VNGKPLPKTLSAAHRGLSANSPGTGSTAGSFECFINRFSFSDSHQSYLMLFPKYWLAKGTKVIAYSNFSVTCLLRLYREFRIIQDRRYKFGNRIFRPYVGFLSP